MIPKFFSQDFDHSLKKGSDFMEKLAEDDLAVSASHNWSTWATKQKSEAYTSV